MLSIIKAQKNRSKFTLSSIRLSKLKTIKITTVNLGKAHFSFAYSVLYFGKEIKIYITWQAVHFIKTDLSFARSFFTTIGWKCQLIVESFVSTWMPSWCIYSNSFMTLLTPFIIYIVKTTSDQFVVTSVWTSSIKRNTGTDRHNPKLTSILSFAK